MSTILTFTIDITSTDVSIKTKHLQVWNTKNSFETGDIWSVIPKKTKENWIKKVIQHLPKTRLFLSTWKNAGSF